MNDNTAPSLAPDAQVVGAPPVSTNTQQTFSVSAEFSGPLPHPTILRGYEKALPGAAERILAAFEDEQKHRQALENKHLQINIEIAKQNLREQLIGQIMGFVLACVLIASASYLALHNHDWVAGVLGGTTLIGALGLFLQKRQKITEVSKTDSSEE